MNELPGSTYQCRNKGCSGDRSFEAAPPSWFAERGLSEPSNCPVCKDWKNAQTDEDVACSACQFQWRVPSGVKIMFHKTEGAWDAPSYCRRCEDDPDWRRRAENREKRRRAPNRESERKYRETEERGSTDLIERLDLALGGRSTSVNPVSLPAKLSEYQGLVTLGKSKETLFEHILFPEEAGGHFASLSAAFGVNSHQAVIDGLAQLAQNENHEEVSEFSQGKGTTVKVDRRTGVFVAIANQPRTIGSTQVVTPRTAFRPSSETYFADKVAKGKWEPS